MMAEPTRARSTAFACARTPYTRSRSQRRLHTSWPHVDVREAFEGPMVTLQAAIECVNLGVLSSADL